MSNYKEELRELIIKDWYCLGNTSSVDFCDTCKIAIEDQLAAIDRLNEVTIGENEFVDPEKYVTYVAEEATRNKLRSELRQAFEIEPKKEDK